MHSPLRYLRGQCIHSNVPFHLPSAFCICSNASVYLPSALIIIGWVFMDEVIILPSPSLASFFLTQQLIYRSKIEKHSACLDICIRHQYRQKSHLLGLGKKHFSYIKNTYFFWIGFW